MRIGLLAMALLLLSCADMGPPGGAGQPDVGGGAPGAPDRSGTRLKVVYERWDAADGSRATLATNRFLDTKLGVSCTFQVSEDGLKRCLPVPPKFYPLGVSVDMMYFLDAACTQRLVRLDRCAPAPPYAVEGVPGPAPCGPSLVRMHQVGAAVMYPPLYRKAGLSCAPVPAVDLASLLGNVNIYPTTVVAPTEFVSGDYQDVVLP